MINGITLGIIITLILLFLCIILSILVGAFLTPVSKTPSNLLDEIADIIDPKKSDTFVDLGSGDGRLVFKIYERSLCKCLGYDISPMLIILSNILKVVKFPLNKDIAFDTQNIFKVDIFSATKIYCYLDEQSMKILRPKLEQLVQKGKAVYSYIYPLKDTKFEKKVKLSNKKYLYIYKKGN